MSKLWIGALIAAVFFCLTTACSDGDIRGDDDSNNGDDDDNDNNDDNSSGDSDADGDSDSDADVDSDSDVDGDSDSDADGDVEEDCTTCGYPVASVYDWKVNSVVYSAEFPAIYNGQETILKMQDIHCNSDKVKSLAFIFGRPG